MKDMNMHLPRLLLLVLTFSLGISLSASGADFLDLFKRKENPKPDGTDAGISLAGLSQEQMIEGLKEALAKGVQHSITNLGREGGFLNNLDVKIPMPEQLSKVEKTLRTLHQDQWADEFVATMNRAAELAVPEAGAIFSDAIKNMTLEDAQSLLRGKDDAATQYFKKTGETRLQEKMLPIIKKTTEEAGVTASYKKVMDHASLATSFLKLNNDSLDVDRYVTRKATDGLFKVIAEEEKRIRQNPAARTTELLKKVFGRTAQ